MPDLTVGVVIAMILLLRVGQCLLMAGCVRSKNAADAGVRCLIDLAVVLLGTWALSGVFAPFNDFAGHTPVLAMDGAFSGPTPALVWAMLIYSGASLAATAERTRLSPLLALSAIGSTVLLPASVWLFTWMIGPARVGPVGAVFGVVGGGAAALVLAAAAGPRKGKFNRDLSVNFVPGHAVPLQAGGLLLMAAGWAGVLPNPMHVLLGFAASLLAGAAYGRLRFGKIDVGLMTVGGIGGLAAAGLVVADAIVPHYLASRGAVAVVAGVLAGAATPWAVIAIETRRRIDDVCGWASAYLVGGTIGLALAALSRRTAGHVYVTDLAWSAGLWLAAVALCGGTAWVIGRSFKTANRLRVSETVEYDGLDLSDLDVNAYPDFQQTMIKSHHLRQL